MSRTKRIIESMPPSLNADDGRDPLYPGLKTAEIVRRVNLQIKEDLARQAAEAREQLRNDPEQRERIARMEARERTRAERP